MLGIKTGEGRRAVRGGGPGRRAGPVHLDRRAGRAVRPGYWAYGARGFTSGLANVSPALSLSMLGALGRDLAGAMDTWELIRPFEDLAPPTAPPTT